MTFPAPNLDSRTFDQLVKEARERIPRFTPDWTNFNDADPGMTLVKLNAWLTETLLHEMNRLPELNYVKFLELLNITPLPAQAATTDLQFTLKKLDTVNDPLRVFIPKNTQVQADDPDLSEPVIFETERTLVALNGAVAAIVSSNNDGSAQSRALVSRFDAKKAETSFDSSFYPFGETPTTGQSCFIGLLLRPHRDPLEDRSQEVFPSGELDLAISAVEVYEQDEQGETVLGPVGLQCLLPHETTEQQQVLRWQVYVGKEHDTEFASTADDNDGWLDLSFGDDGEGGSAALSSSGYLSLSIPEDISQVSLQSLPRSFWVEMGEKKPPGTGQELLDDLLDPELGFTEDNFLDVDWEAIIPPSLDYADIQATCETVSQLHALLLPVVGQLTVAAIPFADWLDLDVGYSALDAPVNDMAWLRVVTQTADYSPKLLNGFFINRVPASAAVTRIEEILGTSDGRPAQSYQTAKKPIYFAPNPPLPGDMDFDLEVIEGEQSEPWTRVDDFGAVHIDSFSRVYRLDPVNGVVTFGDGVNGRIPIANATIKATRYRYGGGAQGNVGSDTITKLKTNLSKVDGVTNPRAATGGSEAETLDEARLRAPSSLKTRERAVTADDFAFLAQHTPGVVIHTAYALANTALNPVTKDLISNSPGAVTVVVLPANDDQAMPEPSEGQLKNVCAHLNSRRLITTELYVTGPRYLPITQFEVDVRATQNADLKTLYEVLYQKLLAYFHPLTGGEQGSGWPFGEDVYLGQIYQLLQSVPGVRRVFNLQVGLQGLSPVECQDYLPVDDGFLLYLSPDVIRLKVAYELG